MENRTCARCNRTYHCPPATSREDESEICPICGYVEVIDALPLIDEEKENIINVFIRAELEAGRIERSEPEVAAIKNRRVKKPEKTMKPRMRIVLDEMVDDPDPIAPGEQATVIGYDAENLLVAWDNGRSLSLIPGVDKYHIVGMTEEESEEEAETTSAAELDKSFEWLYERQHGNDKCPRCGKLFDAIRGAVSRRKRVMICDDCGKAEAIEDFMKWKDGTEGMDIRDWHVVKTWQGRVEAS